jgi:tetratricopeptide (TPR) repeat protein
MMKTLWYVAAVVLSLAVGSVSQALDSVKTLKSSLPGHVVGMSPVQVDLEQGANGSVPKEIPVNQIQTVFYEDEPAELKTAKTHVLAGRYSDAATALERIKDEVTRPEIKQDIEFYKALCAAKMAIGGTGKIADAGRMMKTFADANTKSYHYFEASEVVGDMLVAIRQYAQAAEYFSRLEKAPWPEYKMRAGVAEGRALLAQEKVGEAIAAFDKVMATEVDGDMAVQQRTWAKLGKAAALVAAKKPDEAITMTENILKDADSADASLMARAYNVLGSAHRQAGRTKDALLAFLHVDVLYPSLSDAHAEALANLADLWEQVHKTERANRARKTLEEDYPDSPWAKKGGE